MTSKKTTKTAGTVRPARKRTVLRKDPRRKPPARKNIATTGAVRIRMYNVGFGDCFLVTIPGSDRERRILIDCGSVSAGPRPLSEVVKNIIRDTTDPDGIARIDVVIATHRHRDHISGFANAAWRNVEVGEVWMPWTEDPTDPEARRIRDTQSRLALILQTRFTRYLANPSISPIATAQVQQLDSLMLNALSNEAAMEMLHSGFKGRKRSRFLPDRDATGFSFETDVLPSVTVHVLGPSRDPEVIRDMDPPSGKSYLRIVDGLDALPQPFRPAWHIPEDQWTVMLPGLALPTLTSDDRSKIRNLNSQMELNVATSLDKAVNGTSLMLILKIGSKHLLFPGDAQWGTWQSALKDPDTRTLIKRATFYKVGHHGSHNATPKEYVEQVMGDEILSMCSTKQGTYNEVPREPLLASLVEHHAHVARTDDLSRLPTEFMGHGNLYVDLEIPIE
jgi:beta-lactamase superfamily II metal-dependent hydrolase